MISPPRRSYYATPKAFRVACCLVPILIRHSNAGILLSTPTPVIPTVIPAKERHPVLDTGRESRSLPAISAPSAVNSPAHLIARCDERGPSRTHSTLSRFVAPHANGTVHAVVSRFYTNISPPHSVDSLRSPLIGNGLDLRNRRIYEYR